MLTADDKVVQCVEFKWFYQDGLSVLLSKNKHRFIFFTGEIFFSMTFLTSYTVMAGELQWELGIGMGVLDIPLYPGSSQNKIWIC
ncbi:MAG TPA: hypothetical protein ENJ87_10715 [Gammaproteobacteria bacterium]|nr:hypothetical protein [Gammaproteobacteria bacterium]